MSVQSPQPLVPSRPNPEPKNRGVKDAVTALSRGITDNYLLMEGVGACQTAENIIIDSSSRMRPHSGHRLINYHFSPQLQKNQNIYPRSLFFNRPIDALINLDNYTILAISDGKVFYYDESLDAFLLLDIYKSFPEFTYIGKSFSSATINNEVIVGSGEAEVLVKFFKEYYTEIYTDSHGVRRERQSDRVGVLTVGVPEVYAVYFSPPPLAVKGPGRYLLGVHYTREYNSNGYLKKDLGPVTYVPVQEYLVSGLEIGVYNITIDIRGLTPIHGNMNIEVYATDKDGTAHWLVGTIKNPTPDPGKTTITFQFNRRTLQFLPQYQIEFSGFAGWNALGNFEAQMHSYSYLSTYYASTPPVYPYVSQTVRWQYVMGYTVTVGSGNDAVTTEYLSAPSQIITTDTPWLGGTYEVALDNSYKRSVRFGPNDTDFGDPRYTKDTPLGYYQQEVSYVDLGWDYPPTGIFRDEFIRLANNNYQNTDDITFFVRCYRSSWHESNGPLYYVGNAHFWPGTPVSGGGFAPAIGDGFWIGIPAARTDSKGIHRPGYTFSDYSIGGNTVFQLLSALNPPEPATRRRSELNRLYTDGGVPENTPPPRAKYVSAVGNTLFIAGIETDLESIDNRAMFSKANVTYGFPPGNFVDFNQPITGMATFKNNLCIASEFTVSRVEGLGGVLTPYEFENTQGCSSIRAFVTTNIGIVYASYDGIYVTTGATAHKISDHINEFFNKIPNKTQITAFYIPEAHRVYFFYTSEGNSRFHDRALILDLLRTQVSRTGGCFTTLNFLTYKDAVEHNFRSTAFVWFKNAVFQGNRDGTVCRWVSGYPFREVVDLRNGVSPTRTEAQIIRKMPVVPRFISGGLSFGASGVLKYLTRLGMVLRARSNGSLHLFAFSDGNSKKVNVQSLEITNRPRVEGLQTVAAQLSNLGGDEIIAIQRPLSKKNRASTVYQLGLESSYLTEHNFAFSFVVVASGYTPVDYHTLDPLVPAENRLWPLLGRAFKIETLRLWTETPRPDELINRFKTRLLTTHFLLPLSGQQPRSIVTPEGKLELPESGSFLFSLPLANNSKNLLRDEQALVGAVVSGTGSFRRLTSPDFEIFEYFAEGAITGPARSNRNS